MFERAGYGLENYYEAIELVRQHARIVLHIHPDRLGRKPVTVAENLLSEGVYRNQFETGLSSGLCPRCDPAGLSNRELRPSDTYDFTRHQDMPRSNPEPHTLFWPATRCHLESSRRILDTSARCYLNSANHPSNPSGTGALNSILSPVAGLSNTIPAACRKYRPCSPAGAPYSRSPATGCPMLARCTRI